MIGFAVNAMVDFQRACFPRYSRQEIGLNNLLATRQPAINVEINKESLSLSLGPLLNPLDFPHRFALSVGGTNAWLALGDAFLDTLIAPWATGDEALPATLEKAILSAALNPLLKQLRTVFGARVSQRDHVVQPLPDQALRLGLWESAIQVGQPCAILYLDTDTVAQLQVNLESMAGAIHRDHWSMLAIRLIVSAGQMQISTRELAMLECDDILLLPAHITANTHEFILRQRHGALAAGCLEKGQFVINRLMETTMSDYTHGDVGEPQPMTDSKQLEITLRFDLGELTLSLGELQQVQPGYSFELDLPTSGEVRIVSGAQLIGRGELVQIEDRLGVRVTAFFNLNHV